LSRIHFEPAPPNDYAEYIRAYFDRCKADAPKIVGIAGKWSFEDLIPGMSDFDTRLLVADDATLDDWMAMSRAVGKLHEQWVVERPHWARNLEHLPGISITVREVTSDVFYYPESPQWTFYEGDREALSRVEKYFAQKQWTARDEVFHLKRFAGFYGPYQRGIDPAINMGKWESKYPLHSRYLHYFAPPLQSAVSILRRKPCRGKIEALRLAREMFPHPQVIDRIFDTIEKHYEVEADYFDPRLAEIEAEMTAYLTAVYRMLVRVIGCVSLHGGESPAELRAKAASAPVEPIALFTEGARFGRLMRGRLEFFGAEIADFDADFLIRNELGRIRSLFYDKPLKAYGAVRFGRAMSADEVLAKLRGGLLTPVECDGFARFFAKADEPIAPGAHRRAAREAAALYDPVMVVHDKLTRDLESTSNPR